LPVAVLTSLDARKVPNLTNDKVVVDQHHPASDAQLSKIANAKFLQTHTGTTYMEFRQAEVSAREFPSSAEEGWPRHQKENGAATFDGADGVVLVKQFLSNGPTPPRLRGCGRFAAFLLRAATPPQLRRGAAVPGGQLEIRVDVMFENVEMTMMSLADRKARMYKD